MLINLVLAMADPLHLAGFIGLLGLGMCAATLGLHRDHIHALQPGIKCNVVQ